MPYPLPSIPPAQHTESAFRPLFCQIASALPTDHNTYKPDSNESRPSGCNDAHRLTLSPAQESLLPCRVLPIFPTYLSGSLRHTYHHLVRCSGHRGVALNSAYRHVVIDFVLPTTAHRSEWSDRILTCHIRWWPRRPSHAELARACRCTGC